MGFLDNLENDLKNAEAAAERDPATAAREQAAREAERAAARATGPHAQQLRTSKFTAELLNQAALLGRSRRLNVRPVWLGSTLRLQAGSHALELRPAPDGVWAHGLDGQAVRVDFSSSAEDLARRWLDSITASDKS